MNETLHSAFGNICMIENEELLMNTQATAFIFKNQLSSKRLNLLEPSPLHEPQFMIHDDDAAFSKTVCRLP